MMIKVTVGTNTGRTTTIVSDDQTPKQILADNKVKYETATIHLDGSPLSTKEMNTPLAQLGVTSDCYLIAVIKAENNISA